MEALPKSSVESEHNMSPPLASIDLIFKGNQQKISDLTSLSQNGQPPYLRFGCCKTSFDTEAFFFFAISFCLVLGHWGPLLNLRAQNAGIKGNAKFKMMSGSELHMQEPNFLFLCV